jgi:tetratricopeptide (TPR) repeat protein
MRRTQPRSKVPLLAAAALSLSLSSARASAPPEASAQARADALYQQAGSRIDSGDYQEAIPLLESSLQLKPAGIGARFRLADCYEHAGKLERALELFEQVALEARAAGKAHLEGDARARADGLRSRLPRPPAAIEEAPLAPSTLTPPKTVEASPPPLTAAPPPRPLAALPPPAKEKEKASAAPAWSTQRTLGLVLGGVGLAGLAAGTALGVQTLSTSREVKRERACTDSEPAVCTARGYALYQQAFSTANLSTWMFAVGGAAVIAGVVTFATARSSEPVAPTGLQWHVGPAVSAGTAGLSLHGAW